MRRLFNPPTRRGIIFLVSLILCVVLLYFIISHLGDGDARSDGSISEAERQELSDFEAEIRRDSAKWANGRDLKYSSYDDGLHSGSELFSFDPNTADSATLVRLGLRPWQAHNCRQYIRKGGRWRSPEHFSKLFGLSKSDYERLRPYISITADSLTIRRAEEREERQQQAEERKRRSDSLRALSPEKLPAGTTINLNTADTMLLRRIPQIGQWRARKITEYRSNLGGFLTKEQLLEIEDIPADVISWFYVEPTFKPQRLNVNTCDFKTLVRHPYLNYEQVKAIMQYRRTQGKISSWSDLSLLPAFSQTDFSRLEPYFTF